MKFPKPDPVELLPGGLYDSFDGVELYARRLGRSLSTMPDSEYSDILATLYSSEYVRYMFGHGDLVMDSVTFVNHIERGRNDHKDRVLL